MSAAAMTIEEFMSNPQFVVDVGGGGSQVGATSADQGPVPAADVNHDWLEADPPYLGLACLSVAAREPDMSDEPDTARKAVHEAVAGCREDETADAVLVTAVVVAEWMDPNGDRWISRIASTNGGDSTPPTWTSEGLLHHALYGDWSSEDEEA